MSKLMPPVNAVAKQIQTEVAPWSSASFRVTCKCSIIVCSREQTWSDVPRQPRRLTKLHQTQSQNFKRLPKRSVCAVCAVLLLLLTVVRSRFME
eukprot:2020566-Rhodomonas_salina.1